MNENIEEYESANEDENYISPLDIIRERNILERQKFMENMCVEIAKANKDLADFVKTVVEIEKRSMNGRTLSSVPKRKSIKKDSAVHFKINIPLERRRSLRIAKREPVNIGDIDFNEEAKPNRKRKLSESSDELIGLEDVNYRYNIINKKQRTQNILLVEDVTQEQLDNIADKSTKKNYSQDGTCCHQCRQKTLDTKTICRSGHCIGVRGQFCGPCLLNRYGEKVSNALLDPKWSCPPCRDLCNCSICRTRQGKRPTGIMAPLAMDRGYLSVKDFLVSLNGEGDFISDGEEPESEDKENEFIKCSVKIETNNFKGFLYDKNLIRYIKKIDNAIDMVHYQIEKVEGLRGFSENEINSNKARIKSYENILVKQEQLLIKIEIDFCFTDFYGFREIERKMDIENNNNMNSSIDLIENRFKKLF